MRDERHGANAQYPPAEALNRGAEAQFLVGDDPFRGADAQFHDARVQEARAPGRLSGRDIVCFANDWSGDPLSKKHVMTRLARRNRVLWVNSLGNRRPRADRRDLARLVDKLGRFAAQLGSGPVAVAPNIFAVTPLAVPDYRSPWARRVNQLVVGATVRAAMRALRFADALVYSFVPASAWVARRLGARHVVYHCVDEHARFAGAGDEIARLEAELIAGSDLVITCSAPLQEAKARLHPNTHLVRHGVEHAHFARALDGATAIPDDVRTLPRPRFGFFGLVAEWVDLEALARLAAAYPRGSVVVVGEHNHAERAGIVRLHNFPNVHLLGRRPYSALPGYCKAFDVALLPFVRNALTVHATPLKLREYLAAGLPVIATDIPEAAALADDCAAALAAAGSAGATQGVFLADGADAFVARAAEALAAGAGPDRARSAAVARESWDAKVADIENLLLEVKP
jgi:glycosyltransferase involved in cell wall biosynthesis